MKNKKSLTRILIVISAIVITIGAAALLLRASLINLIEGIFGPPRDEYLEPSIYEHLSTTCFDDQTLETCELVTMEIIRARIQPKLNQHGLTFVDYFSVETNRYSVFMNSDLYEFPEGYEEARYFEVDYHILIAKNALNEEHLVYLPFEIIKDSDMDLYHYPIHTSLMYEDLLDLLNYHLGDSLIFDFKYPNGTERTFQVILNELLFKPNKIIILETNKISLFTATSLFVDINGNWEPYTSSFDDALPIWVIYDGESLIIENGDGFITAPRIFFEYQLP